MEKKQSSQADEYYYERKLLRLNNLIEVSKIINSSLDKETQLEAILFSCQGQFAILNVAIFVNSIFDDKEYNLESSLGLDSDNKKIVIKESDPLIKKLKEDIQYIHVNDIKDKTKFKNFNKLNKFLDGNVILPLKKFPISNVSKLNGFLVLGKKFDSTEFNEEEISHIITFAELASVSVENMILFEIITLDRMTKLHNHFYFQTRLNDEVEKAKKQNYPLSLLLMDLDHFKKVNDTYGHQVGDHVIKSFANYIRSKVREGDIVARYGGEEFAAILPETTRHEAEEIAMRIKRGFTRKNLAIDDIEKLKVTASFGIAEFKKGLTQTDYELVHFADQALYYSKKNGRNRVTVYEDVMDVLSTEK